MYNSACVHSEAHALYEYAHITDGLVPRLHAFESRSGNETMRVHVGLIRRIYKLGIEDANCEGRHLPSLSVGHQPCSESGTGVSGKCNVSNIHVNRLARFMTHHM